MDVEIGRSGSEEPSGHEASPSAASASSRSRVPNAVYEAAVKGRQDFRSAYREAREALSRSFQPTDKELAVIRQIAAEQDLSEQAVMRQALRLYQLHLQRLQDGETFSFSGDAQRAAEFAGLAAEQGEQ